MEQLPSSADYIEETIAEFRRYRQLAERALAQIDDEAFGAVDAGTGDAIATYVKHVGGNLRSRWTDFLTSDGEKPDRHRDNEFVLTPDDTRSALMERWAAGWDALFGAFEHLVADDLGRIVTIRREPHTVLRAAQRSLAHVAYHTGQIVLLAKRAAGSNWKTLSIPRGGSDAFARELEQRLQEEGRG